jgi:hypothetical protein
MFDANQASVSTGLAVILSTIKSYPKISRKQLAEKALGKLIGDKSTDESSPEYLQAKTTLATDLIWLAKAGHVIEFADGTLDLPLPPRPIEAAKGGVQPSARQNLEGDETDGSADDESSTALLETSEPSAESKPEVTAEAQADPSSEIASEERVSRPETPVESVSSETAAEPSLRLPADTSEILETDQESLQRVDNVLSPK